LIPDAVNAKMESSYTEQLIIKAFSRMDKLAFAVAVGSVCGLIIFLSTLWLMTKGGEAIGPNLRLLSAYFTGYTISMKGAFIGAGYTFLWGFITGWLFAYLRNLCNVLFIRWIKKKAESVKFKDLLDHI